MVCFSFRPVKPNIRFSVTGPAQTLLALRGRNPSLHFVRSAFATENMARLLGASVIASSAISPAAKVCTNLVAANNLLFGRNDWFP
jgi:hypothetical protein